MSLTPRKRKAIELLAQGMRASAVAQAVGCGRATLWKWSQAMDFRAALEGREVAVTQELRKDLRSLRRPAVGVLKKAIEGAPVRTTALRAADLILKTFGDLSATVLVNVTQEVAVPPPVLIYDIETGPPASPPPGVFVMLPSNGRGDNFPPPTG